MQPHGRRHSCLYDYLFILWILVFPDSSRACPKPCACYVKTEVHCTFRYLNVIPKQIQTDVERINLGYNSISRLTENDFSGLHKLELLMLHSNEIQTIHEDAFNDLSSLQVLKMSYNKVKTLHRNTFRGLKSLVRLHMDHNKLEFLAPESFYSLKSLKMVHLEGNALRQLHTDTFVTLRYIQIFKTSSIRHIYLSDNQLSTLPKEMFLYLTDLEGLYLHGNPLSCDCNLQWITELGQQARDLIKCKRDRSGQQCPLCITPEKNKGRSLNEISSQDFTCVKPTIENIYKLKNVTTPEDGGFTVISAKDFVAPMGSLILNMTDQSGNEANLACNVQRPTKMSPITLDNMEEYTTMRTTLASSLVCSIDYDHIQKLWGILAMYSDSPMKLKRDLLLTKTPFISYKYKQVGSGDDVFTDIEADIRGDPNWLMQDSLTLQLDRTATTLSMLHIQYLTDVYITIPNTAENQVKTSWVMIKKTNQTQTEYAAIMGGTVEMNCEVMGEPVPNIEWVLPDGSKIRAPYVNEEGRITITKDGKFILKAADRFDTGVYHCIATNYMDSDVLTYRITVVEADVEEESVNGAEFLVSNGDVLYLPCGSIGVPDASVSWILPDHSILHHTYRDKFIFTNGTLRIQDMTQRERGHFRCIAANQYGLDILTHRVLVKETKNGVGTKRIQLVQIEDETKEGSGSEDVKENNYLATGKVVSQRRFPTRRINTKLESQGNTEVTRRNRINQRFRGHRRPFAQNSRRIDPQRWTEILEKTKKNSLQSQTPTQATETSAKEENAAEGASGEIIEASGEGLLPVAEKFSVVSATIPAVGQSYTTLRATKQITSKSRHTNVEDNVDLLQMSKEMPTESSTSEFLTKLTGSPHYIDTLTHTTVSYPNVQPTTMSSLNTTSVATIPNPEPIISILESSLRDVTTNSMLKSNALTSPGNLEDEQGSIATTFSSLTTTPQIVITHPEITSSAPYTAAQDFLTASPIASSEFDTTTQTILEPTLPDIEMQVTNQYDTDSFFTTSGYSNNVSENVVTSPLIEISHITSSPPNTIANPDASFYELSTQSAFEYQTTISSYVHTTPKSILDRPRTLAKPFVESTTTITKSPLSPSRNVVTEPPIMHKSTTGSSISSKEDVLHFQTSTVTKNNKNGSTEPPITHKSTTGSNISPKEDVLPFQTSTVTENTKADSTEQAITSTTVNKHTLPTRAESKYLTESHEMHLNPNIHSTTISPYLKTGDKLQEGKELSIDTSTKSSTKVFLSHTDIGPIYIHSTQKIISPKLPAGSTIISHQQIQIVKEVTPMAPTLRRYGRRRFPGRRRLIRPGRIPNVRIHQFKYGKSDVGEVSEATTPHPATFSDSQHFNQLSSSTATSSPPLPTTQSPIIGNIPVKESTTHETSNLKLSYPTTNSIILQPATDRISQNFTFAPSYANTDIRHTQHITPDTSTILPITSNEGIVRTTPAKVTTKPRITSKVIRRKIPWHRLFGNNQISQREILKKIGKNNQLSSAIINYPTSDMANPNMSTVKALSAQPSVSHPTTVTNKPSVTKAFTKPSITEKASTLYPTSVEATQTEKNPISTASTVSHSTSSSAVTGVKNFVITKSEPVTASPAKTTTISPARSQTFLSTNLNYPISSKVTQAYSVIDKTTATVPSQAQSGKAKTVPPPNVARTPSYSTSTFVNTIPKDTSTSDPKSFIYSTASPVTSSSFDSTTRLRFSRRKRPRKKNPYSFLAHNNPPSQKETSTSSTFIPSSDFSSSTVTMAQTTSSNEIPLTTVKKSQWNKTSKAPKLFLQQSPIKNAFETVTMPHFQPSDKNYLTTTNQAEDKNIHFKRTFATPKTKKILSYYKVPITTTPFPFSVTAKMLSVLTDPSPISVPPVTQPPNLSGKKMVPSNVEIKPDVKPSQRNVHIIAHIPSVLTKTTQQNLSSAIAPEPNKKPSERTEEIPSSSVHSRPHIVGGKAASFTVLANSDAYIPCEATGNPTPTILWTKVSSGTFVSKTRRGNRMEVFPNGTLSISSVGIQDRGQYLCVASNQYGSDRLLVTLSVITYPPRILQGKTREITVHSGSPVNIKCQAEGRPFPAITWILANETIASEKSAQNQKAFVQSDGTLTITEVSIYDRGIYKCLATNIAGADTFSVKVQVIAAPPAITEEKRQTVLARAGENVKLHCTAKGNPMPSVHWVASDGTKVKPLQYVNTKLFLFSNGSLYIRNAAPSDNGNYECIATSSTGSERRVVSLLVEASTSENLPRIVQASPKSIEMNHGNRLILNCTATGEPKPRILWRLPSKAVVDQWHRMGSRIQVYPNGSLVVQSVNEKDAGDYLCVARNKMGDDIILMKVSITMKPAKIIQKQQLNKEVPYGKDFKVDCKASGSPSPEISWSLPDGTVINNVLQADDSGRRKRRYVLFDNGTLYLNKVGMAEEGDYTCYAENTLGRDEMKVHITVVKASPQIKINTRTTFEARAGGSAVLDCEANGEPKPKIFWLLPSSDMIATSHDRYVLHENGSLTVNHVKLLDAGEYMCVARNPAGDDTKLLKLDVLSTPPIINGLYTNKTVITDSALKHSRKLIHCKAEGAAPLQIMWIMPDNIYLTAPYHGSRIIVHQNGTLDIRNVRSTDTAEFTCVARNDGGESMLVVRLEVQEVLRRPMFKNPFNEKIIAKPGKMAILNCFADGNPTPEIIWLLPNGSRFVGGQRFSRYQAGINGTLLIYSPNKDDAGKYRCAARNKVGYIEKLIILEVGQKPSILTHPRGLIKGMIGEMLSLHCLSDGIPKPSISWTLPSGYIINRPQLHGKHMLLENGTLLVQETTIHDRGNYSCKAKNNAGEASISVSVIVVAYPPRITSKAPQNIHTRSGSPVHLNCMAIGIPKPEITWELPDLSVLTTASKGRPTGTELLHPQGTLVLQNARPSDTGIYKCIARNILGTDSSSTYLKVI
ncbi:immunoglobulin superfamily member 10 [Gastrophryne carolinensis]